MAYHLRALGVLDEVLGLIASTQMVAGTPVPGNLMLFFGLLRHQAHSGTWDTHIYKTNKNTVIVVKMIPH